MDTGLKDEDGNIYPGLLFKLRCLLLGKLGLWGQLRGSLPSGTTPGHQLTAHLLAHEHVSLLAVLLVGLPGQVPAVLTASCRAPVKHCHPSLPAWVPACKSSAGIFAGWCRYDDGDEEHVTFDTLQSILLNPTTPAHQLGLADAENRRGRFTEQGYTAGGSRPRWALLCVLLQHHIQE